MKLNGHDIAEKIYHNLHTRVSELKQKQITPHLVVFLIGANPASVAYVTLKQKRGEEIGCKVTVLRYPETVTTEELHNKLQELNNDDSVHGILIQRPLPAHIDVTKLELATNPEKDIDGFHPDSPYTLPLPLAVVRILEEIFYSSSEGARATESRSSRFANAHSNNTSPQFISWLKNKHIVITGKGPTGGGPIIKYLQSLNVTTNVIDSKTPNPETLLKQADIIIASVGKEGMITAEHLKKGVILIGVGILRGKDGKLHGDYETEDIKDIASFYTTTPGGVGPVNVAMLLENLLTAAER